MSNNYNHIVNEEKNVYLITWVTYSSRISERMKKYGTDKNLKPVYLTLKNELLITEFISEIILQNKYNILAFNICRDHVHMLLYCKDSERNVIIRKIKGQSAVRYKMKKGIKKEYHLWAQKYNHWVINTEKKT